MIFLNSNSRIKNSLTLFFRLCIVLSLLSCCINPAYAIPPPETLALLGGSIVYPGLLIIGLLTIILKYIWIKTKLYLVWRLYLARLVCVLLTVAIFLKIPLFSNWMIINHPVTIQTIKYWQQSDSKPTDSKPIFIDLRDQNSYDKIHVAKAINFPEGKGLTSYLRKNPHKNIILYCELGLRSASLRWLKTDASLLKQALDENRVFYFPGGLRKLIKLGEKTPVQIIINISSIYANYLEKNYSFHAITFSDDKKSNDFIPQYKKITAQQSTPIINSNIPHDFIAEALSQLNIHRLYFTTSPLSESYPIHKLLLLVLTLSISLFIIRRKELFCSLFTKPSPVYKWANALISMAATVLVIQFGLFNLSIPFDLYLYQIAINLPMNILYPLTAYTLFGFVFMVHLVYPNKARLKLLRFSLSNLFFPSSYTHLVKAPTWKQLLIVSGVVYSLYKFCYALPTIFILSIFLLIPIIVDLVLYRITTKFKNIPTQLLTLLSRCGFSCNPSGDSFLQLSTHHEPSLAKISITVENKPAKLGLFSGKILDDSCDNQQDKTTLPLKETTLMNHSEMVRRFLLFFQQDIELNLDRKGAIISLKLYQNHFNTRIINRHILLQHHQLFPGVINEKRFTSTIYQDVFTNPNPLVLDILKQRWDKNGGNIKALHKLGLLVKRNSKTKKQFIAFSNRIYLDETVEKTIFSTNKLSVFIRKKALDITLRLATDSLLQDYYTTILPKAQIKLTKLTEHLDKPQSTAQLKRIINRALTTLCKESAMWQCYSSVLHQQSFHQLQRSATKASYDLSNLINAHHSVLDSLPLPTYYELSSQCVGIGTEVVPRKQDACSSSYSAFLTTETIRTAMRQLQLKEWQLISLLLEKLRAKLMLPISLVYLTKDDFLNLPNDHSKLIDLLAYRYKAWQIQNEWNFPASFSLQDMEQLPSNSTWQNDTKPSAPHAIRVSGNQPIMSGHAIILQDDMALDTLPKESILVATNLLPEQIIACQHINGIILEKGGYLSHTSIIAREKNIPIIAQFQISTIKDKDKLLLHSGNQVSILNTTVLEWVFLDGTTTTATIGNKAQRLAIMNQYGFHLPTTIILKHHSVEKINRLLYPQTDHHLPIKLRQDYYDELKQLLHILVQNKSPIIVRSSTNVEDSNHYSYAGIFYSQPNVYTTEDLIAAIDASWKNLIAREKLVKQYSGETQLTLNLILQPYIKGQFGGVLFTKTPKPGLMHVEIAPGGVEGVTAGNAELTSLYIDETGQPFDAIGEKNNLSKQQYQILYRLGCEIETLFGKPQDIEWIIADHEFYIIQSRDMLDEAQSNRENSVFSGKMDIFASSPTGCVEETPKVKNNAWLKISKNPQL